LRSGLPTQLPLRLSANLITGIKMRTCYLSGWRSGIWERFIPDLPEGQSYKYHIQGFKGITLDKGDTFANLWEGTASVTHIMKYRWNDDEWMHNRKKYNSLKAPWSIYEVHLASWMRPDRNDPETYYTYQQFIERLVPNIGEPVMYLIHPWM
jgi:1,4-alpha-glucan branching enzyme